MSIDTQRRPRWPLVFGTLAVVGVLGFGALLTYLLGGAGTVLDALGGNGEAENTATGQMGKPVTDGNFEFTVTKMTCGASQVGGDSGKDAQGQFCVLDVTVHNVGSSAEAFADLSQTAYDSFGHEFPVDSAAGVAANKVNAALVAPINPDATARGKVVFDVPVGTKLTSVILHESMFSPGVKIPLK